MSTPTVPQSSPQPHDAPGLGRRTLLRGTAWSVPVVAITAAAPAYANSACGELPYRVNWNASGASGWTYAAAANGLSGTGHIHATPSVTPAPGQQTDAFVVSVTNQFHGRMRALANTSATNMQVTEGNVGGTGSRGLTLAQNLNTNAERNYDTHNDRQVITFTFDRDVTELSFTITDIDGYKVSDGFFGFGAAWQYRDNAYVSLPTTATLGDRVSGSGTASQPWRSNIEPNTDTEGTATASSLSITSNRGNVALQFAQAVRSFSLTFYNSETRVRRSNGQQAIYLTNFSFTANSCK